MNKAELDKALKTMQKVSEAYGKEMYFLDKKSVDIAIFALREARERAEGCWHCRGIDMVGVISCTEIDTKGIGKTRLPEPTPYNYCPNCGRRLEADDLQDYADTPEAWAKRRVEGQLSGNSEQVKEASDDKT